MSSEIPEKNPASDLPKTINPLHSSSIYTKVYGIWKVVTLKQSFSFRPRRWFDWEIYTAALPSVRRFVRDIYTLDPTLVILFLIVKAWKGVEPGITVYITGQLFKTIENFLHEGQVDARTTFVAIFTEVLAVVVSSLSTFGERWVTPRMMSKTEQFFEEEQFQENLRYDVQTLLYSKKNSGVAYEAWHAFCGVIDTFSSVLGLFTILTSIFYNQQGGPIFTAICLVYPLLTRERTSSLFEGMVVYSDNVNYLRIQALQRLAESDLREDIITSNLANYIMKEYRDARKSLGDIITENPIFQAPNNLLLEIAQNLANQLPLIYFALCAIFDPSSFSLTSLAILRQQSSALQSNVYMTFSFLSDIQRTLKTINSLYTVETLRLPDGNNEYSPLEDSKGMSFELRDVTFDYPGTKAKEGALVGVSMKINAGQLVVVVGANGSGKSTFIKLLTRMYDVTSGEILVDGLPIQSYKMADLHDATATLTQDHSIYPLSLAENIGLGYSDRVTDLSMIEESAKKGGSSELIARLKEGFATNLEPVKTAWGSGLENPKNAVLQEILDTLEVPTAVSGGERQRIVASRTFMRLLSPKIKFVAVDEPSSALDPRGELQLFDKLREENGGKTMIFVTHRFGHLTKHADLIICMKDGRIVESGSHLELLSLKGEYASLYNIQAQAFFPGGIQPDNTEDESDTPPSSDAE